jgi:hypothetical protein
MGRSAFLCSSILVLSILILPITGCSSGKAVTNTNFPVPASISISPSPYLSLEVGTNQAFTASMLSSGRTAITEPVFYQSSNTAVVTVAANGLACAGSWDNLSNPQICTPGPVGVAQVTATAQGVTSAPTTVYVHQHIDSVTVSIIPPIPPTPCLSVGQSVQYQATAFSHGANITSTVGVFTWQAATLSVATLSAPTSGPQLGQVTVTAKMPGVTPIFATIGTTNSVPINFTTCAVQSISLQATNTTGTASTITPTVIDVLGTAITGVPLTWSSSQPASVTVNSSGGVSASAGGAATVIASCTPPTCNTGFPQALPIYPENVVEIVGNSSGTSSSPNSTVYVSSTGCGTTDNCVSTIVPITASTNAVGTAVSLPATPNSLVFDRLGAKAYLGTNSGLLGSTGLMVLPASSNAVNQFTSAPGKVLAISPDGLKVIVSDTADQPNQVFIFDAAVSTSTPFSITGATAADFSPDSLKAYIIAGSTLYVYSKLDALQTIPLAAPPNDVAFLAEGAFAYLAGGDPAGVMVRRTCDNADVTDVGTPIPTPSFVRTLPGQAALIVHGTPPDTANTFHMLAVDSNSIDIISVNTKPQGCTPTVSDGPITSFNLGRGNFVAKQLIISESGSTAYIISPNLSSILVFNISGETSSSLTLIGNAIPLQASLSPDGNFLFVGASDGMLHTIQTATGVDTAQIPFPLGLCQNTAGQPFTGISCNPDLVAVKP